MPITNQQSSLTAAQIRQMRNEGLLQPIANLQRSGTPYDPFYGSTTGYGANPSGGGSLWGSPSLFGYSGLGYVAPTLYQIQAKPPRPSNPNVQATPNISAIMQQYGMNPSTAPFSIYSGQQQQQQPTQFDPYNTGLFGTPQQQSQLYQGTPPPTMGQITSGPTAGQPVTANALASYLGMGAQQQSYGGISNHNGTVTIGGQTISASQLPTGGFPTSTTGPITQPPVSAQPQPTQTQQQAASSNPTLDSHLRKLQASGQQIGSGGGGYGTSMPAPTPQPAPQPTTTGSTSAFIIGPNGEPMSTGVYYPGGNAPYIDMRPTITPNPNDPMGRPEGNYLAQPQISPLYLGPPVRVDGGPQISMDPNIQPTAITNTTRQQTGLPTNQAAPPRSQQAAYSDPQSIFENYNPYQAYQYPQQQQSSGFNGVQLGFSDPSGTVSGNVNGTLQSMQNTMDPAAFTALTNRVRGMSSTDIAQWLTTVKKSSYQNVRTSADLKSLSDEDLQAWYTNYQNDLKQGNIADIFNPQEGRLGNLAETELRNRGLRNTVYSPTQVQDISNKINQAPPWELAQFVQYQEGLKSQQPNWNAADEKLLTTAKQKLTNLNNQIYGQPDSTADEYDYPTFIPGAGGVGGQIPAGGIGGQLGSGDPYLEQLYNTQVQFDPFSGLGNSGLFDIPDLPNFDIPDYTQGDIDFQAFLDSLNLGIDVPPPGDGSNGGPGGGGGAPAPGPLTSVGTPQIPVEPIYTQQQIAQQLQNALAGNATNYGTELLMAKEGLGGRGFNTQSPAFAGANARAAQTRALADVAARRDIPIAMQQANAQHIIEAMAENAKQRGLDISTYTALINAQQGILSPLLGALVGIL